ncbi:hypothetical protein EVAR_22919_1 [Eumeta japonica]|uniref:Uncharacterized protein n=1 Tax=Eumeta variegata TaxID=151549 RepID=A0A4C1UUA4_EUMVA|nr:hypothetical protein EVAR_22919_1 [Eumeta japonica]
MSFGGNEDAGGRIKSAHSALRRRRSGCGESESPALYVKRHLPAGRQMAGEKTTSPSAHADKVRFGVRRRRSGRNATRTDARGVGDSLRSFNRVTVSRPTRRRLRPGV